MFFCHGHADCGPGAAEIDDLAIKILRALFFYEILSIQPGFGAKFAAPVDVEITDIDHCRTPQAVCLKTRIA